MMFVLKSKYFEMVSRLNNEIRGLKLKLADEKGKMTRVTTLSQEHFFDKDKSILIFFKDKQEALFYCIVDIKLKFRVS